ncbi:MAG: FkbM family methyltransferase [Acutalibacteraceae bacterium]|nr:FkbM family methyltransferase [Acutalibacteraceae bacterium]
MLDFMSENKSSWEKIKESGLPVVIYGMGNGADKVLDEFIRLDIPVKGVTASDDFVRGQIFRGYKVTKLSEFDGEFIVAIAFASCIPEVMNHIFSLQTKYHVLVPCVPVLGDEIFNRDFIVKNKDKIMRAYNLFEDDSKAVFAGCIDFIFGGELNQLKEITTSKNEVFDNIIKFGENESYLDLGAYRGDTVEEFIENCDGKYNSIIALEPDRRTFRKLCEYLENIPDSVAYQKAVYSENKTLIFSDKAGRQSAISSNGTQVEAITVDTLCSDKDITYIKMDVEGVEYDAIEGAKETLKNKKPVLNIALYHRSEDIFELPIKISEINPEYKFYIRKHPYIPCWDMNLYCI